MDCLDFRAVHRFRMVDIMAIVLTNGNYYIATSKKGGIIKTPILEDAQTFYSVNTAMRKISKAPGKCKGYYPYDTEDTICKCDRKKKRRNYSEEERKIIYNRSSGRCELCGKRLLFEEMTLDHIVPVSMGGADDMENLQASCLACNQFKSNILPDDFMDRINKIFMYQMEKQYKGKFGWKIVHKMLNKMI